MIAVFQELEILGKSCAEMGRVCDCNRSIIFCRDYPVSAIFPLVDMLRYSDHWIALVARLKKQLSWENARCFICENVQGCEQRSVCEDEGYIGVQLFERAMASD